MSSEIKLLKSQIQDLMNKVKELEEKNKKEEFVVVERVNKFSKYYIISGIEDDEFSTKSIEEQFDSVDTKYYDSNNYFHTKEEAEKYLKRFLLELKILRTRDKINDDWKPNWNDGEEYKYCICINYNIKNTISECTSISTAYHLSFESEEKRNQFRELISDEETIEFLSF